MAQNAFRATRVRLAALTLGAALLLAAPGVLAQDLEHRGTLALEGHLARKCLPHRIVQSTSFSPQTARDSCRTARAIEPSGSGTGE